jgi:adhesin transport system membrane fusion protein
LKSLIKKEYVSKLEYLNKEREVNQLESDKVNLTYELDKAKNTLKEYEFKFNELNTSLEKDAVNDLNKATDELLQVQYALDKLHDKVARTKIYSPIAGLVKGIEVAPGAVINPSAVIMTIVPSHQQLQVETKITTLDIGHVHVGDPVRVKVLTYDYARYGSIYGVLTEISPTTFFDEANKMPYYKGLIELDKQYVNEKQNVLQAGMTAQADIVTGSKTVLEYLIKPIYNNLHGSFHER